MMTRAYAHRRARWSTPACSTWASSSSFVYGVLLFDDPVTWMALAGMALIVGAGIGRHAAAQPHAAPHDAADHSTPGDADHDAAPAPP